ncbi:NRDE family protein [Pelagibaculum spongiae]|uniref:NRDE family protein n=1 Tax=Pelagibaculum spongiae TaxID=2080658 RepID=A0A2V1H0Z5_9GAMM|nr:NRDE family protein [Pelagibaculum spongiae]PVZ69692.1 hypothetical protein DC094_10350 [Pelagibaculum spongiae]
MCTVSWLFDNAGYQLFFNRDEQRTRALAEPPSLYSESSSLTGQHCNFLMPIDPVGKGSWIAVNETGLSLCLLNFYQGEMPKGPLVSRGQLVRNLIGCKDYLQLESTVTNMDMSHFAPFTLVAFFPEINQASFFQWSGQQLETFSKKDAPFTSSSVKFPEVSQVRFAAWATLPEKKTAKDLLAFHRYHGEHPNHLSICLHRDDATSVSLSHIAVSSGQICFDYYGGSPCETFTAISNKLDMIPQG